MRTCERCLYDKLSSYERKHLIKGKNKFVRYLKHILICAKCSWSDNNKYFVSNTVKYHRMGGEN